MEAIPAMIIFVGFVYVVTYCITKVLVKGYESVQNVKNKIKSKPNVRDSIVKLGADIVEEVEKRKSK